MNELSGMTEATTSNKEFITRYHLRLWESGDLSAIDDCWAPDASTQLSGFDDPTLGAMKADATRYQAAFTDIETSIDDLLSDGDRVVLRWTTSGLHVGKYGMVEPTRRRITMTGIDIYTVRDALIRSCVSVWDGLDVFDQLGVLPQLY